MEDSGAILCEISSLKDMLDQVNVEIEESIQTTREIESEIVKCSELEAGLAIRESELMKMVYVSEFEITGLKAVTADSRTSVKFLEEELSCLKTKCNQILCNINLKREGFATSCLNFQKDISGGENDELRALLLEKECLQNNILLLEKKNNALRNSLLAFVEEILEDLHSSNSGELRNSIQLVSRIDRYTQISLSVEIQTRERENEKLQKDIDELKTTLISVFSTIDDQCNMPAHIQSFLETVRGKENKTS